MAERTVAGSMNDGTTRRATGPRYAVYFCPAPCDALWQFGSSCLGYDSSSGLKVAHPAGLDAAEAAAWAEEPRRYGFHATLKAPFMLPDSTADAALLDAAKVFCRTRSQVDLGHLRVERLGRFVALVLAQPISALHDLADDCVRAFEVFRAPLDTADLARRRSSPLSDRQQRHLATFGYPHVFEDFRFHMTLTGNLEVAEADRAACLLGRLHAPIDRPVLVDAITILRQDHRDGQFRILERLPFDS